MIRHLRVFGLKHTSGAHVVNAAGSALTYWLHNTPNLDSMIRIVNFELLTDMIAHDFTTVCVCMCLFLCVGLSCGSFVPKVVVSVCNETIWHTDPLPLRFCGLLLGREKVNYRSGVSPELSKSLALW